MTITQRLAPLTSVRFFAAFAVVLFHGYQLDGAGFARQHPGIAHAIEPVVTRGDLAVDLFFVLSGVVLAWNYAARLGPRFSVPGAVAYLRARLARVYPLYLVITLFGGVVLWMRHHYWHEGPYFLVTVRDFLEQAFMVQQWHRPGLPSSWCGPAWSISCEWAAYLALPVLMLLIWRLRASRVALSVVAVVAMTPLLYQVWRNGSIDFPYSWAYRIGCDFVAGTAVGTALLGVRPSPAQRRVAEVGLLAVVVGSVVWVHTAPERYGDLIILLWLPLVALLAVAAGPVSRLMSTRVLVLGGEISYALYLLHQEFQKVFHDIAVEHRWTGAGVLYAQVGISVACIPLAWVLFRFVEEPLRHRFAVRRIREVAPA